MHIFPNVYQQREERSEERKRETVIDTILRANKKNKDVGFYELISTSLQKYKWNAMGSNEPTWSI
jgi:hypothetical protein